MYLTLDYWGDVFSSAVVVLISGSIMAYLVEDSRWFSVSASTAFFYTLNSAWRRYRERVFYSDLTLEDLAKVCEILEENKREKLRLTGVVVIQSGASGQKV